MEMGGGNVCLWRKSIGRELRDWIEYYLYKACVKENETKDLTLRLCHLRQNGAEYLGLLYNSPPWNTAFQSEVDSLCFVDDFRDSLVI